MIGFGHVENGLPLFEGVFFMINGNLQGTQVLPPLLYDNGAELANSFAIPAVDTDIGVDFLRLFLFAADGVNGTFLFTGHTSGAFFRINAEG